MCIICVLLPGWHNDGVMTLNGLWDHIVDGWQE